MTAKRTKVWIGVLLVGSFMVVKLLVWTLGGV